MSEEGSHRRAPLFFDLWATGLPTARFSRVRKGPGATRRNCQF